jgi:hypothetical protein
MRRRLPRPGPRGRLAGVLALAPALVLLVTSPAEAQCPSYETCAFQPADGRNPSDAELSALFEAATEDGLGAAAPELGQIEVGLDPMAPRQPVRIACVILKPIAAAESRWQQFCPDTGRTVISFDCGFGLMQVTSGAMSYGPKLASESAWNIGAGTKILVTKWNEEQRGGPIGDRDPLIVESWYYAVWAYNGFTFGNNPDNPEHPPNRPPFNGPGSISRRSYPYQEIVWGYLRYPLDWQTTPRWPAIEVTYPAPGQVGMTPGPLPKLEPEHRSTCAPPPCEGEDCPFELVIDDREDPVELEGALVDQTGAGYEGGFRLASATWRGRPDAFARYWFRVPTDAAYAVEVYVPDSPRVTSRVAPVALRSRGATLAVGVDQTDGRDAWAPLGVAKLMAGVQYAIVARNDSGEEGAGIGFDAVRITRSARLGDRDLFESCVASVDCRQDLICDEGQCVEGCDRAGCAPGTGTCDPIVGLCSAGGGGAPPVLDAGVADGGPAPPGDGGPASLDGRVDAACGCRAVAFEIGRDAGGPGGAAGAGLLLGLLGLARRGGARRPRSRGSRDGRGRRR